MAGQSKNILNDAILKNMHDIVERLWSGSITVTVSESRITRIETTQKQDFEEVWLEEGSGI